MKICLVCRKGFEAKEFRCPECGYSPKMHKGHPAFAPGLSAGNDGFRTEFFASLYELESDNFWFESRNRLLIWALDNYFPNTNSFFEIGCGTGFVLAGVQREFQKIMLYGSDIFSEGFAYAKQRVNDAEFFQMDARRIPFENEFDVVGAFDVIEHVEEDELVLTQIFRAIKSGGGLILTVPQHQMLWSKTDEIACHKRRYSKKGLAAKVENAGFRILRLTSFFTFLLPLMVTSRLIWRHGASEQKDRCRELRQPMLLNSILAKICDIERGLIRNGASLPVGGSLLCVGLKV